MIIFIQIQLGAHLTNLKKLCGGKDGTSTLQRHCVTWIVTDENKKVMYGMPKTLHLKAEVIEGDAVINEMNLQTEV